MIHPAVVRSLRRCGVTVDELSLDTVNRPDLLSTFLQSDVDVHGSHGLFYWLRTRGAGTVITRDGVAVVLTLRPDVARMVAVRPVGAPDAAAALVDVAACHVPEAVPFVVRYCASDIAGRLRDRGWTPMRRPWRPDAPADDETFPEVIVTAPVVDVPGGQRYRPIREAISRHHRRFTYHATASPAGMGEDRFVHTDAARAANCDDHEAGFATAVRASLAAGRHDRLTYHYLTCGLRLAGFAITANLTGTAHGYYLSTVAEPRLTAFFLWHIYLQQRRSGAHALNLGGSETVSLHRYKTRTFPDHLLRHTVVLQSPHPTPGTEEPW